VFTSSLVVWFILKKTVGIRVSLKEEIEGLDIGEHGNQAYPEFATHKLAYSVSVADDK
jgi:Amt family ammonium transporter